MISGSAAAAGGPTHRPAQVLAGLLDTLTTLLTTTVTPETQDQHNADVAKLKDQITQAKADLAAEEARMAEERAALDAQSQKIQAQNYWLMLDQNMSNEVMRRKYRSRLPPVYEGMNLFNTPVAGPSNPAGVNRTEAPGAAPDQPRVMYSPRRTENPPQYITMPPGHFSSPLDNMIAIASRLAAISMEGDSLAAVET